MKILVTGCHGQVGHALTQHLQGLGEIHALGREQLDLARPEAIRAVMQSLRPAIVINAAAYTAVDQAESEEALRVAAMIEKALADGDLNCLQPHAQQALIGALCRLYAANSEAGNRYPIVGGRTAVTATDVMVMCGALLKAVDLQVFELGMWQSWSSN
jgi:NAD(P)-dependent dehydrogenase (short-subunit alcohol dehydrogenase family)